MDYKNAREWVESTKQYGSLLGLDSIRELMHRLDDVQDTLAVIHVAGTNGKGSTCSMLASVYEQAGYRVGRYSSPAVFSYREVFQVNGDPIERNAYAKAASRVRGACEVMLADGLSHPTVFEVETAIAFVFFADMQCDLVILETGMGGATDATNLIQKPVCSVLTTISMDHMAFLGNTISEIAGVKAGILKEGCPAVSTVQEDAAAAVIAECADRLHCAYTVADTAKLSDVSYDADGMQFTHPVWGRIHLHLTGSFQLMNAALALEAVDILCKCGYPVEEEAVRAGIEKARWSGRFETIADHPRMIIDGAHNEDAAKRLYQTLVHCFPGKQFTFIIGVLADKEHEKMLKLLLPLAERVYTVTPHNPRAMDGADLAAEAGKYHDHVKNEMQLADAVRDAFEGTPKDGVIVAFGSLSYLGELREEVRKRGEDR